MAGYQFPLDVMLTDGEIVVAGMVGQLRDALARAHGRRDAHGYDEEDRMPRFELATQSCAAELAVAKAFDKFWTGAFTTDVGLRGLADVSDEIEVRFCTTSIPYLVLHDTDADDRPFFLVTGRIPLFSIRGWAWGREGKVERYWRTDKPRAAYFVPAADLRMSIPSTTAPHLRAVA